VRVKLKIVLMTGVLKSDAVQIASTTAGIALAAYFIVSWREKKKIDPSIDPLKSGADPNFPGGAPIQSHFHDPSPILPSCEIYDPTSNLFMNLGNPELDKSKSNCFDGVNRAADVRYVDSDGKPYLLHDQLYLPGDVAGSCYFPDQNGKLFTFPSFATPNQSSRLCFNSADTQAMSSFFMTFNDGSFQWNPDVNLASAYLGRWIVETNTSVGLKDVDEVQVLTDATLTDPESGSTWKGKIFVRDSTFSGLPNVTDLGTDTTRRLFMPSRSAIVYFNPRATDDRYKYVAYPMKN
jgi:hypothetical protein